MSDDLRHRTVVSLLWKFLERGGFHGIQLLVQVVLARLLTPADFGLLAILLVFSNLGIVIVQSGLNTALVQAERVGRKDTSTVFWISLASAAVLYVAIFASAPWVAEWYRLPQLIGALRISGLVLFVGAFNSIQVALVARSLDFKPVFVSTVAAVVTSGAAGIAMAYLDYGYWALIAQQLSYQVVVSVVLVLSVSWRPRLEFDARRARDFFGYGWKLASASLLDTAYLGLYDLVVGKVFSQSTLGYFAQGKRFPSTLNSLFDGTIQSVMLSTLSKLQGDPARARRALRKSVSVSTLGVASLMAAMYVSAPSMVTVVLSEKWSGAIPFVQAFCILYVVQPVQTGNLQAVAAMGRSDMILRTNLVKRAIGVAILGVTTLVFRDPVIVAYGAVFDGYLAAGINASMSKRLFDYGALEQLKDLLPVYALTATSAVGTTFATAAMPLGLGKLVAQLGIFSCVQLAAAWLLRLESFTYLRDTLRQYATTRRSLRA